MRLCTASAKGPGLIPGQGTRSCLLQLRFLHAKTKTWHTQKKKKKHDLESQIKIARNHPEVSLVSLYKVALVAALHHSDVGY